MMKLEDLLEENRGRIEHKREVNSLVSNYACGCVTNITFAGRPQEYYHTLKENDTLDKSCFHDNSKCKKKHPLIAFKEFSEIRVSAKFLATELLAADCCKITAKK